MKQLLLSERSDQGPIWGGTEAQSRPKNNEISHYFYRAFCRIRMKFGGEVRFTPTIYSKFYVGALHPIDR